jgi:2-polyprenyl-3-methyl-5-hydroxy-6-metoxy-1,4-benzoquinol methylase
MSFRNPGSVSEDQRSLWRFTWRWVRGKQAIQDNELLASCANLFSGHYGVWSAKGPQPGKRIRIPPSFVASHLDKDEAWIACAYYDGELIGYCSALLLDELDEGRIAWVTQLVVHESFRESRVATKLLFSIWQFTDCYAWGLITANPFAVRALETATRRPCRAGVIRRHGQKIAATVGSRIDYVPQALQANTEGRLVPKVRTNFYIDHSRLPKMLEKAARADRPWSLGELEEGEEWFACTFKKQEPKSMDPVRMQYLLEGADEIWIQAYEGMTLKVEHRWHNYTEAEAKFILRMLQLNDSSRILDVGCGDGRHSISLARMGMQVTGVDISPRFIELARHEAGQTPVTFELGDARVSLPTGPFDAALCLFDVLGSSAKREDDIDILRNIRNSLKVGGLVLVSVMNHEVTAGSLSPDRKPQGVEGLITSLEELTPSNTMEQTGSVFDTQNLLLFDGVYYRKEQFSEATWRLPAELIVRDRRFSPNQLKADLHSAGFQVISINPVQAGQWDREPILDVRDARAKELLAVGRRTA